MDRITRALELARQARESAVSANVAWAPDGSGPFSAKLNVQNIFERTRSIPVEPEVLEMNRVLSGRSDPRVADAYRVLRTRVTRRMRQNGWRTLGITSAQPGDGKTLTAINLGIAMALERERAVILVDTDLRRPQIHARFGLRPELGLVDCLKAVSTLEDTLIVPGIERFALLPSVDPVPGSSELLASSEMARLIEELRARDPNADIIFDLPPVLVGDDVLAFTNLVDAVLMVVEDGKTQSDQLVQAIGLLDGVDILGIVLNRSSEALDQSYSYD